MNEPYRPSNGTDGDAFMSAWCSRCARDKPMSEGKDYDECDASEVCPILARAFVCQVAEWVYDTTGAPVCAAFIPVGQPVPFVDTTTGDLFA